jgi:phosphoserine phosphatase RsbU/P
MVGWAVVRASDLAQDEAPLPRDLSAQLLAIAGELQGTLDPEALFPAIARQVRTLVDYDGLVLLRPAGDGTLSRMFSDPTAILASGTPALALPLVHRERLSAVLHLEARGPVARADQEALASLAPILAAAIETALAFRETRSSADQLATLYDIGKETASILDLDELLQRLAEVVKRVIDYEMFGILLLDEETDELVLRKAVSFGSSREKTRIKVGEGLCGAAARDRQPIVVGDVQQDPRYVNLIPETRSELVVPLIYKDRVVGVFDLESSVVDRFTEEHVRVLTPLASQVAVALENARLYEELSNREERVQHELAIARRVQHGLFPEECPSGPGWEASAHFRPAHELGGDLYDFYDLGDGLLGLAVGDVSGKGVPAALYGAFASGSVRGRAFQRRPPGDILAGVNRTLRRRGVEGMYCTLAFALFDFTQRRVRLANSGLPYPLHFQAATGRCAPVELPGLPLGVLDGSAYEERVLDLPVGDALVFHTDGVSEASRDGEEYGVARLRAEVERHARLRAPDLGAAILADLESFLGPEASPSDDLTLVVVKAL